MLAPANTTDDQQDESPDDDTAPPEEAQTQDLTLYADTSHDDGPLDSFGQDFAAPGMADDDEPYFFPAPDVAGLFDNLDERIHSSDAFPDPSPEDPVHLTGGEIPSLLQGGTLGDTLVGGSGNDTLVGLAGDDWLQAGQGATHMNGGEGDDTLIGGAGNDTLIGGAGDDLLIAGQGNNTLQGDAGHDTLVGVALDQNGHDISGRNFLNGGSGDDVLIAGQGDYLHGGDGADSFALGDWLQGNAAVTIVDFDPQEDQVVLHYDPARLATPEISVQFDAANPDTAQIWLDGHLIANVGNAQGLTAQDIALVPVYPVAMGIAAE
ncbi:calcium-binding protein [Roseinatronobacter sp. NSM]|uniref:calcium-binding protein n=1 Tax=Roseinatronobacter sp. NSM TaxID=3457785 RepID=UPI004035C9A4